MNLTATEFVATVNDRGEVEDLMQMPATVQAIYAAIARNDRWRRDMAAIRERQRYARRFKNQQQNNKQKEH